MNTLPLDPPSFGGGASQTLGNTLDDDDDDDARTTMLDKKTTRVERQSPGDLEAEKLTPSERHDDIRRNAKRFITGAARKNVVHQSDRQTSKVANHIFRFLKAPWRLEAMMLTNY